MLPLRSSRQQTVDYYNRKLIADIRLQACLLQKELYEKNNAMQPEAPEEFQMREGEIPVEIASAVRDELPSVHIAALEIHLLPPLILTKVP